MQERKIYIKRSGVHLCGTSVAYARFLRLSIGNTRHRAAIEAITFHSESYCAAHISSFHFNPRSAVDWIRAKWGGR